MRTPAPSPAPDTGDAGDARTVLVLLAATFALRLVYIFNFRIDSDEPQHLHVVWAWTQGLLPYRDVFDNHMPLFQLLCAPLLRAVGEEPNALIAMRLAMLPLYALALVALLRIARTVSAPRTAWWTVAVAAVTPAFFFCSVEFRTDDLWMLLWLLALMVAVEGTPTPGRIAGIGLLLGAALAVSLKSVLMVIALGVAGLAALPIARRLDLARPPLARSVAAGLAGFVAAPLAVIAPFAAAGALGPFLYGTVLHNLTPGLGDWGNAPHRWMLLPVALPPLYGGAVLIARAAERPGVGARRAFTFLAGATYLLGLGTLWPLRTRQDYLPAIPLLALLVVPFLVQLGAFPGRLPRLRRLAPAALAVGLFAWLLHMETPWSGEAAQSTAVIGDVLRLLAPGEPVMDAKGDAVFRPRPYYYALEHVTKRRIDRGLIVDDIPERLVATGTTVAVGDLDGFPRRAALFLGANYVWVGTLRVAGHVIAHAPTGGDPLPFEIHIPASYAIVTDGPPAGGTLDGTPYIGPRQLDAGHHEYSPARSDGRVAVLWARAAARGFSPFHPPDSRG